MVRFKNSWILLKRSFAILFSHKKLLVFPLISFSAMCFIVLFFLGGIIFQPTGHSISEKEHWVSLKDSLFMEQAGTQAVEPAMEGQPVPPPAELVLTEKGMVLMGLFYLLAMFIATFFNVAFYHEILEALSGRPAGIRNGIRFALSRLKPILLWSLFAGIIGYIIRLLEERLGIVGKIVVGLIGLAWSVASVFAIPIIVVRGEKSSPIAVLKESASTLKKTWGESLIGFLGLSAGGALVVMGSLIPLGGIVAGGIFLNNSTIVIAALLFWLVFLVLFSYVSSVAGHVYRGALFIYATTGNVASGFSREMMDYGWKHKKPKI